MSTKPQRPGGARLTARQRAQAEALAAQRRRDRRILALLAALVIIVLVGGGIALQAWRGSRDPTAASTPAASASPQAISNGRPVVLGDPGAQATVAIWADFHCPHCYEFEAEFGPVLAQAQEQGKISQQIYPLAFIDQGSVSAANAFGCAAEQGFGQAYYTGLFANHTLEWNDDQLLSLAKQVAGSPPPAFETCVRSRSHLPWLQSISDLANRQNVSQTPTVFLDGTEVNLADLTPERLTAMIDKAAET